MASPLFATWSSVIVSSVIAPLLSSTGASFAATTFIRFWPLLLVPPSPSVTTMRISRDDVEGLSETFEN